MNAEATVSIIGESVLLTGDTIAAAARDRYEPLIIVWGQYSAVGVHTGFTVHADFSPKEVALMLRKIADEIDRRATSLVDTSRPLPFAEQERGLSGTDDSGGCGYNLGGG